MSRGWLSSDWKRAAETDDRTSSLPVRDQVTEGSELGKEGTNVMTQVRMLISAGMSFACLTLASAANPAYADGLPYDPRLEGYHRAVPVPAPVPVPETDSGYYLRVDGAWVRGDSSNYNTSNVFHDDVRAESGLNDFARIGVGAGYRFSHWLRGDLTVDVRSDVNSRSNASRTRAVTNTQAGVGVNSTILLRDTVKDSFKSDNTVVMVNGYVDVPNATRFTPYIGAGIGVVRHRLWGRHYSTSTICIDTFDCDPNTVDAQPSATVLHTRSSSNTSGYDYALAVAVMAGFSYEWWENVHFDMGYRWLHLSGTKFTGRNVIGGGNHSVVIPDQNNHELRFGLRWEIN